MEVPERASSSRHKSQLSHCLAERRVGQIVLQHTLELEAELLRIAIGREQDNGDDPTAPVRVSSRLAKPLNCSEFVSYIGAPFAAGRALTGAPDCNANVSPKRSTD